MAFVIVRVVTIPVMRPRLPNRRALEPYLDRIDKNRVYSNFGPLYSEFAVRLASYIGVSADQIAIFANGTLALQAAIETRGREGDTWAMPSWTFVATAQATKAARRRVHFIDVECDSWSVQPSPHSFAAGQIVVSPFGSKPPVSSWQDIAGPKIFDAASCFDACKGIGHEIDDQSVVMVSLHATKALPAGEGAFLVGPADWIRASKIWGNFGFDGSRVAVSSGLNAKISEYHCAVGLAALDNWDETRRRLESQISQCSQVAKRLNLKCQPSFNEGFVSTTWNIELHEDIMSSGEMELENLAIETRRWWPCGVHEMPEFRECTHEPLPTTQKLSRSVIGLPFGLDLSDIELAQIETGLRKITGLK